MDIISSLHNDKVVLPNDLKDRLKDARNFAIVILSEESHDYFYVLSNDKFHRGRELENKRMLEKILNKIERNEKYNQGLWQSKLEQLFLEDNFYNKKDFFTMVSNKENLEIYLYQAKIEPN